MALLHRIRQLEAESPRGLHPSGLKLFASTLAFEEWLLHTDEGCHYAAQEAISDAAEFEGLILIAHGDNLRHEPPKRPEGWDSFCLGDRWGT